MLLLTKADTLCASHGGAFCGCDFPPHPALVQDNTRCTGNKAPPLLKPIHDTLQWSTTQSPLNAWTRLATTTSLPTASSPYYHSPSVILYYAL